MSTCRNCHRKAVHPAFCDLGFQPFANSYLTKAQLSEPEITYPLVPFICEKCGLVQLPSFTPPSDIFSEYAYFSGQSADWVKHLEDFAEKIVPKLNLTKDSHVLEVASNDGALLRILRDMKIPALGVEPAENIALAANLEGLATIPEFMGLALAHKMRSGFSADLIVADNVMAHVPDLDDFLGGIEMLLAPDGTFVVEFPDLGNLVKDNQFDTIYHEHFSYFSKISAMDALSRRGFVVYDVEQLPTHGGSLRIYAHRRSLSQGISNSLPPPESHLTFASKPPELKQAFLYKLVDLKRQGKRIAGYGAPAKGNTMLNYAGIRSDLINYVVDSTPAKQDKYLPGSRIPIKKPEYLDEDKPDAIVILPWNWTPEIVKKLEHARKWGAIILSRTQEV
jgi:SAM-dependent methyltransferase